jgi:hypothetical protein
MYICRKLQPYSAGVSGFPLFTAARPVTLNTSCFVLRFVKNATCVARGSHSGGSEYFAQTHFTNEHSSYMSVYVAYNSIKYVYSHLKANLAVTMKLSYSGI